MSEDYVIISDNLSKSYGGVDALKELNLKVPRNSIFGFLGPNGAGKSTTIKLLLGLIMPTKGTARIFERDMLEESLTIRHRVGYLAQHPRFYTYMTAREVLRLAGHFFMVDGKQLEQRVQEMLELVGLQDKAGRRVEGFSGGEIQRLGIAQAQIHDPDLLILDEPAAALDPMGREQVLAVMEQLRENATVFFSTHILDDVQRVSDEVAILNHGRLVAQAPIDQLLAQGENRAYTLLTRGEPQGARARLSRQGWVSHIDLKHADGLTSWRITVNDDAMAEKWLLRLVLDEEGIAVLEFGREKVELEDVFMRLVREND